MLQSLVSSKYQIVIPKKIREKACIKSGQKLNVYLAGDQIILSPKKNWPEDYIGNEDGKDLRGLWKKIDIRTFLDQERDSWGQK